MRTTNKTLLAAVAALAISAFASFGAVAADGAKKTCEKGDACKGACCAADKATVAADGAKKACGTGDACKGARCAVDKATVADPTAQATCPVMSKNPINKKLFVDQDGKRIYVCCKGCIGKVQKDFAKYAKEFEDKGVVLEKTPAAAPAPAPEAK